MSSQVADNRTSVIDPVLDCAGDELFDEFMGIAHEYEQKINKEEKLNSDVDDDACVNDGVVVSVTMSPPESELRAEPCQSSGDAEDDTDCACTPLDVDSPSDIPAECVKDVDDGVALEESVEQSGLACNSTDLSSESDSGKQLTNTVTETNDLSSSENLLDIESTADQDVSQALSTETEQCAPESISSLTDSIEEDSPTDEDDKTCSEIVVKFEGTLPVLDVSSVSCDQASIPSPTESSIPSPTESLSSAKDSELSSPEIIGSPQTVRNIIKDLYYGSDSRNSACYSSLHIKRCIKAINSRDLDQIVIGNDYVDECGWCDGVKSDSLDHINNISKEVQSYNMANAVSSPDSVSSPPSVLNGSFKGKKMSDASDDLSSLSEADRSEGESDMDRKSLTSNDMNGDSVQSDDCFDEDHILYLKKMKRAREGSTTSTKSENDFVDTYMMNHTGDTLSNDKRAPLCCGYLLKLGGTGLTPKNWKKRWFVLRRDNCLYYYKTIKDKIPVGAVIMLNYLITRAVDVSKKHAFKVSKGGAKTYYFSTKSTEEMRRWMTALSEAAKSPLAEQEVGSAIPDCTIHNVSIPALSIKNPECHGYLWKQGHSHKSWKRRYCVLKHGCLYYYADMSETVALGIFKLRNYSIKQCTAGGRKHAFMAVPPNAAMRVFYFSSETETDYRRWVSAMDESIHKLPKEVRSS